MQHVRWPRAHPCTRPCGGKRTAFQPVPHHRPVLAHSRSDAHRAQPPRRAHGEHPRGGERVPGVRLHHPEGGSHGRRDPPPVRLLHGCLWQVARNACARADADGSVRPLADRAGVRALLRDPQRGGQPVRAADVRPNNSGDALRGPRRLPHERGHHGEGDRMDAHAAGLQPAPSVLHLPRHGSDALPAPRVALLHRSLQGSVRRRVGRTARAHLPPPTRARRHPCRYRAHPAPGRGGLVGGVPGQVQAGGRSPDGGLRRIHGAHR